MDTNVQTLIDGLKPSFDDTIQFESAECCRRGRQVTGIIARVPDRAVLPVVYVDDLPAGSQDAAGWVAQRFKDILAPLPVKPYRKASKSGRESLLSDVILRAVSVEWSRRNPHFAHYNEAGIVGRFYLPDDDNYLTEGSANELGISIDELKIAAAQNTLARFGLILADTSAFSNGLPKGTILQSSPFAGTTFYHDKLYWLTNDAPQGGAALMLIPEVMNMLGDLIGGDYYVAPMNTHGVLIASTKNGFSSSILKKMVADANLQSTGEDVLSSYIYQYDHRMNRLKMLQS